MNRVLCTKILKIRERRFPEHSVQPARKCPLAGANRRGCFAKGKALAQPVPCPVLKLLHERGPRAQDDQESRKSPVMNGSISRNRAANSVTDGLLHLMSHSARSICANAAPAVTKPEELTTMHDSASVTSGKRSRNSGASHHEVVARRPSSSEVWAKTNVPVHAAHQYPICRPLAQKRTCILYIAPLESVLQRLRILCTKRWNQHYVRLRGGQRRRRRHGQSLGCAYPSAHADDAHVETGRRSTSRICEVIRNP